MDDRAGGAKAGSTSARGKAGIADLFRLGAHMAAGLLRHGRSFDAGAAGCRWARAVAERERADTIALPVGGIDVVAGRTASERVLSATPHVDVHGAGATKRAAMSFLAPRALTVADGADWARLRPFNEHVLATGRPHPSAQQFLDAVRMAFDRPVATSDDVRAAMAVAMTRIVLGSAEDDEGVAEDVRALFDVVQSPVRRKLLGWRYRSRRARLFATLQRRWTESGDAADTLIGRARSHANGGEPGELLDQVPHWMFTFTGSGTDLLVRTLALVTARPSVRERALEEMAAAGGATRAESVEQLAWLHACVLETGRLFPPVTRTFHSAPGGRQLVHWFPLLQRDDALGADVHAFRPERWLGAPDDAAAASNLFLRGPRSCPGSDLIVFVCKAALARLIGEFGVVAHSDTLARDPLPFTFPAREARFSATAVRVPHAEAGT